MEEKQLTAITKKKVFLFALTSYKITINSGIIKKVMPDRSLWKMDGQFTWIGYKIAGCQRMDTQGGFKRIDVFFVIVAGLDFPVISRQFIIRGDSDTSRNILEFYGGRKEAIRAG